ncbi:unnamed protein product [Moneuplotes crassus]|uniref:Uncharacterized protein n=1 Tax=Euplotes crassus TaxID=5936 RepID=A0AAD1X3D6_EUPCR|nr:unnamed protein product [Moneuplotes crassus]
MEFNNPIASAAVVDQLTNNCWEKDEKFNALEMPNERIEINNDIYERPDYDYEFDPYDAEIVENTKEYLNNLPYFPDKKPPETKKKYISNATKKRRERLGLPVEVPIFPEKVDYDNLDQQQDMGHIPKRQEVRFEDQEYSRNTTPIASSRAPSEISNVDDSEDLTVHPPNLRQNGDIVWEKDTKSFQHFQNLKDFEKLHDAKLYYNTMLPPLRQSNIGKQLKMQTEPFSEGLQVSEWPDKYKIYQKLKQSTANFQVEESDTDLDNIQGSPYFNKNKVKFDDQVDQDEMRERRMTRFEQKGEYERLQKLGAGFKTQFGGPPPNYISDSEEEDENEQERKGKNFSDDDELYERNIQKRALAVNQKYRNLHRRKIPVNRVTKYDQFTNDERIPYIEDSDPEVVPRGRNQRGAIRKNLKVSWNRDVQDNEYIRHQMDSIDYWQKNVTMERERAKNNLINHAYQYLEFPNKKLPPSLFSTVDFYNDLHERNSEPNGNYNLKKTALNNWRKRNFGEFKIKNRPIDDHFQYFEPGGHNLNPIKDIWKIPVNYRPHKQRPNTDSELQQMLKSKYNMGQRKSKYHKYGGYF